MTNQNDKWEVSTGPKSFVELQKRKEFVETLPQNVRDMFEEQIESVKEVLSNHEAYSDEQLIAKTNSLKEIKARIEIAYQANESAKATRRLLKNLW